MGRISLGGIFLENQEIKKGKAIALLPILVFVVLYLGLGVLFEYVLKIDMGFYNIPIVIVFLIALTVACFQNRALKFDDKLDVMAKGVGDKNIFTMLLIFLAAGAFVGVVGRSSAESVAYFMLSIIPPRFAVAVLFVVACFVSTAMGTSVGTITLITPIAVPVALASGFSMPLCVGSVIGGAMFGDNLSFISDTTIAACNGQGVSMKTKFQKNFFIALPAAVATLALIIVLSLNADAPQAVNESYDLVQIIPYVLVLLGGIIGINVFLVLLIGIVSGAVIMLATGATAYTDLLANMGTGAAGMFETAMVAVLVAAICALIREYGGFDALLYFIRKVFKGKRGGQFGMGLLVGLLDIATANNTVAIVVANPIAKEMTETYDISPRKTASLLDTFSCIVQGVLPYGAQMLVALAAVTTLGQKISAFDIIPFLFYPMFLLVSSVVSIAFVPTRKEK
ncbi:MAG: Na+/H+ antiporter NhaC family protein [Clostridia bacterium]|nr:Na+/H+ antiporter NhaC family protein [Clostridia bacterium]